MYWNPIENYDRYEDIRLTLTWDVLKFKPIIPCIKSLHWLTLTWDVLKFLNFLSASSGDGLTLTWDVLKWLGD